MAQIELSVALRSRLRRLAVWVHVYALEISGTSQFLQMLLVLLPILSLIGQYFLSVALITSSLTGFLALRALFFGQRLARLSQPLFRVIEVIVMTRSLHLFALAHIPLMIFLSSVAHFFFAFGMSLRPMYEPPPCFARYSICAF